MAGAPDHVELLLARKIDELDGVAADTDRKVRVFRLFGMLHRVDKLLGSENVDVKMVSAAREITVHDRYERRNARFGVIAERRGMNRLGIGNTVKRVFIRKLRDGIERGEKPVPLGAVRRIRAGRERLSGFASVGH